MNVSYIRIKLLFVLLKEFVFTITDASASGSSGQVVSRCIKAQSQIPSLLFRWLLL